MEAELEDHQAEKARAAAEGALTAAGVRVIPWPDGGFHGRKEAALRQEGQWHFSGSHLEIDVASHEEQPCHAGTVTARSKDAQTIWICTDPDRHRSKGESKLQLARRDEAASKREEARARRAAERARAEFMAKVLAGRLSVGAEATAHVLEVFVEAFGARTAQARIACSLLGLDPEETTTSWGASSKDWQAPLQARAKDRGGDGLATVALALAFAAVEEGLQGEWHAWGGARDRAHFQFLERLGYAPSDFEAGELRGAERRQADDERQLAYEHDAGEGHEDPGGAA